MDKYWEKIYTDIYDGVSFKIKKINPIDHINLACYNMNSKTELDNDSFIKQCVKHCLWSKDGYTWFPVIDDLGNARLPEVEEHPAIIFDLYYNFRQDVLVPVFLESKTFQKVLNESPEHSQE